MNGYERDWQAFYGTIAATLIACTIAGVSILQFIHQPFDAFHTGFSDVS
jgi:hypothetical protein